MRHAHALIKQDIVYVNLHTYDLRVLYYRKLFYGVTHHRAQCIKTKKKRYIVTLTDAFVRYACVVHILF